MAHRYRRLSRAPCRKATTGRSTASGLALLASSCVSLGVDRRVDGERRRRRIYIFGNAYVLAAAVWGFHASPMRRHGASAAHVLCLVEGTGLPIPLRVTSSYCVCCVQFSMPPPWLGRDSLLSASAHQRRAPKRFFPHPNKLLFLLLLFK